MATKIKSFEKPQNSNRNPSGSLGIDCSTVKRDSNDRMQGSVTSEGGSELIPYADWTSALHAILRSDRVTLDINAFDPPSTRFTDWRFFLSQNHPSFKRIPYSSAIAYGCGTHKETIVVADSMWNRGCWDASIPESWEQFRSAIAAGNKIVLDLSKLHNPLSWLKFYEAIADYFRQGTLTAYLQTLSTLNEVLSPHQRLITVVLNWDHKCALEYARISDEDIFYLSRHLRVQPELLNDEVLSLAVLESLDSEFFILEES